MSGKTENRGRPPKWDNPEAFSKAVDEYFDTDPEPTWTGLALFLDFESRQSLWEYGKKDGFSLPIKKALLRIEQEYEKGLRSKNPTGSIFALKNFNWKDRQEIDQTVKGTFSWEKPKYIDEDPTPTGNEGNP